MKITLSCVFLAALIACASCDDSTTTQAPTETPQQSTTVDTTTLEPTTTPIPTTSFPSTSTIVSTSTEPATSTPPTTSSSTTPPTTTSTTPGPITTTKSPEPPVPVIGSWNVTNEDNVTCIRVDLQARFEISVQGRTEYIALSPNATGNGNCNDTSGTQTIELQDQEYTIQMTFDKDATDSYLRNISFSYTLPEMSGYVHNDTRLFSVKIGNSYLCSSMSNVIMGNVSMEIFTIHLQSYGSPGNKAFGTAEECEADNKVNDIVPIAVGIALLALVVVVLIAYFVGRRRSRQKGYQSV